jgi:hypothetical protein
LPLASETRKRSGEFSIIGHSTSPGCILRKLDGGTIVLDVDRLSHDRRFDGGSSLMNPDCPLALKIPK